MRCPSKHQLISQKSGFTLIEMLIAVTLSTMLLLTISAMFMTFLASGAKTNIKKSIIQEGEYAQSQMDFIIRNAIEIVPNTGSPSVICEPNMDRIALRSKDGWVTEFRSDSDKIASVGGQVTPTSIRYLTSTDVTLTSPPEFDCNIDGGATFVTTSFTLSKDTTEGNATETFSSTVQVRNN